MKSVSKIVILVFACILSSCDKWLDVLSNEEILEEDAFSSYTGYRLALIGAYRDISDPKLYGQELTWGFLSAIGRNYYLSQSNMPYGYWMALDKSNYENKNYTQPIIAGIWEKGYEVIANVNNLLKNIASADSTQFEYPWEKNMIIAEARGLRAVMHFELLRLFVPAPITGYSGRAIPYVRDYPVIEPEYNTLEEVIKYIIEDLEYARKILYPIDVDIMWKQSIMSYMSTQFFYGIQNICSDGTRGNGDGFFSFRCSRINYYGVMGMLARVYSYKRDNETAVKYIDELLDEFMGNDNFDWGWYQQGSILSGLDGKRIPEPLLSFRNETMYEDYTKVAGTNYFQMIKLDELFGEDKTNDYRYKNYYDGTHYLVWQEPESSASSSIRNYSGPLLPVIEIPELFYIRCEYLAEQGDIQGALAMLKQVKDARGVITVSTALDYNSFMELLINDATRDFLTRGQTWHYLKKLNWKQMYNGTSVKWEVPDEWFVLPIPDSETAYY